MANDQAIAETYHQLYVPVFFSKLAEYGVVAETSDQQQRLLSLVEAVRGAQQQQKTAGLDRLLAAAEFGLGVSPAANATSKTAGDDAAIVDVAAQLVLQRPELAKAVLESVR